MSKDQGAENFLIDTLKGVINGIAKTFGSRCEVVLHDLRDFRKLHQSIIAIENGHVTGRTIGDSITDQGLKFLRSQKEDNLLVNYRSMTSDGRSLKSTSIIIRDEKRKPIVAICINFDVTDINGFNMVLQEIFGFSDDHDQGQIPVETFQRDMFSTLDRMAANIINKAGKTVPSMGKKDKIEITRQLSNQGFFMIKGAIRLLAAKLNVSKYTIYNYLEEIRSNDLQERY